MISNDFIPVFYLKYHFFFKLIHSFVKLLLKLKKLSLILNVQTLEYNLLETRLLDFLLQDYM